MQHHIGQHERRRLGGAHPHLTAEAVRQGPAAQLQRGQTHRQQQRARLSLRIEGRRHRLEAGIEQTTVGGAVLAPQARPGAIAPALQPLDLAVGRAVDKATGLQRGIERRRVENASVARGLTRQPRQSGRCGLARTQTTVIEPLARGLRAVEAEAAAGRAPEQLQACRRAIAFQPQRLIEMERLQTQRFAFLGQQAEGLLQEACRRKHHLSADGMVRQICRCLG